jgi:hypothetical protein
MWDMPFKKVFLVVATGLVVSSSCQSVRPYQRAYINDASMQTGRQPIKKFSGNMHTYREGASGGGRGKSSGGCGCN